MTVHSLHEFPLQADRSWLNPTTDFHVVVVAASAGGIQAMHALFETLPEEFPLPILVVQHRSPDLGVESYVKVLGFRSRLPVRVATEGEALQGNTIYVAPAGRHLEFTADGTLSVRRAGRLRFVCPSADLLFESATRVFGSSTIGVVLSGAGCDGAEGVKAMRQAGGFVIAQDERTSIAFGMPGASINTRKVDLVLGIQQIGYALCVLTGNAQFQGEQTSFFPPHRRRLDSDAGGGRMTG